MHKHFLAILNMVIFNELTELEVSELTCSMIDKTALARLKKPGSRGITIV